MTIRRINVSQINGNNADTNDVSEIRPYGEIGLYEGDYINSLGYDRLELLIHDGKRTHLKSKVLSPGMFYGSNADSGDGLGLDTIKLIPDAGLYYNGGNYGNDQYLVVDPTAPNHIHIRAGGTIDQSNADLFLGGEQNHVKVSDGNDAVTIRTSQIGEGVINHDWVFDNLGNLTLPGGMKINSGDYGGSPRLIIDASTGGDGYLQLDASATILIGYNSQCNVAIGSNAANTMTDLLSPKVRFLQQAVPASSVGAPGDIPGLVTFDGSYIYYCTGTYGGTTYDVVHSIAEGTSANGVDSGYLVANTYQLPEVGWKVYYNGETRTIDQVNSSGIPGFYVIFVNSSLVIPGQATFAWGPTPVTNIWKRLAWSNDTW